MKVPTNEERAIAIDLIHKLVDLDFLNAITFHRVKRTFTFDDEIRTYSCDELINNHWFDDKLYKAIDEEICFSHGACRYAIITSLLDNWVVKTDKKFLKGSSQKYADFCANEELNFLRAKNHNLEEYFAPCYELCTIDGHTFFLQERVNANEAFFEEMFADSVRESVREWFDDEEMDEDDFEYEVSCRADDLTDEERIYAVFGWNAPIDDLQNFISDYNINDLHSANWGTTLDIYSHSVIMDYAGY